MSQLSFATDARSEQYCRNIIDVLVQVFHISQGQAVYLLNKVWGGQDFVGEEDWRYYLGEPEIWIRRWKMEEESTVREIIDRGESFSALPLLNLNLLALETGESPEPRGGPVMEDL